MTNEPRWRRYLRFYRRDDSADLEDELRDHLQSTVDSLVARGMSPTEARAEAQRRFGDVGAVRNQVRVIDAQHSRASRLAEASGTVWADVVFALRQLARAPSVAAVTAVSIGLGVALNVAIFSVANGLLLRPISGVDTERLVRVYVNRHSGFNLQTLHWLRDRATTLDQLAGEDLKPFPLDFGGRPERIAGAFTTQGYWGTVGAAMTLGRGYDVPDREGTEPVVVLSHAMWRSRYGSDSSIVGRAIRLGDVQFTVVGVTSPAFSSAMLGWAPDLFVPVAHSRPFTGISADSFPSSLYAVARLRPGVTRRAADAELATLALQLAATDTARYGDLTFRTDHMRGMNAEMRTPLAMASAFLLTMVLLVLAIACANVASLLLGRASARQTEIGVRVALGASRIRLVRQLLTESLVLALLGGVVGVVCGFGVLRFLTGMIPAVAGLRLDLRPDLDVLAYAAMLCVGSAMLFGLAPALRASSPALSSLLRRDADGPARSRVRAALVSAQVALCVVLLAVAVVLTRSFVTSRSIDPGFAANGILDLAFDVGRARTAEDGLALYGRIGDALAAAPGVKAVVFANIVPLSGNNSETSVIPEGSSAEERRMTYFNVVSPRYFSTIGIALAQGREFLDTDRRGAPRVAVVNETAARRWWPGADAVGKRLRFGGVNGDEVIVVGIARESRYNTYGEDPTPFVYVPLAQGYTSEMVAHVRVAGDGAELRATLIEAVRQAAPALPPPTIKPMSEDIAMALWPVRIGAVLLSSFGAIALLLAAAGIYGVTTYAVSRRTREIGIRVALGAQRGRVLRLIVLESMRTVGIGGGIGLLLALGAAFVLSRFLYGVTAVEPAMLIGVPLALGAVAFVASWLPARRAARVDPLIAIRSE